jgi:phytoene dehydrogenase-like protein
MTTSFVGDQQWREDVTRAAAVLSSCPALHQRLRVVYATGVVAGGVHKVYRALRRALPRTRVEVVTGPSVPGWLRVAA